MATQQPSTPPNTGKPFPNASDVSKWDSEKLLDWLQSRSPPALGEMDGPCCQKFTAAKVSGLAFLHSNAEEFESEYGVLYSVAKTLTVLASRINATHSRMRPSPADNEEGDSACQDTAARNWEALRSQIAKVSPDSSSYCDPSCKQLLPFPFPGTIPASFQLDENGCFEYYGRSKFRELYRVATCMDRDVDPVCYFHGTVGAGKSHLLAALTCLLMRQGMLVVFIPDCNDLLADPAGYFTAALEFAYGSKDLWPHLEALHLPTPDESTALERLTQFCWRVAEHTDRALFIVDQANALEDAETQRFNNDKKQVVRSFLGTCTAPHRMLAGCTPNCKHTQSGRYHETSEKRIDLYGGLNDEEMEAWWTMYGNALSERLHPPTRFRGFEKETLENLTGRLPIFLRIVGDAEVENAAALDDDPRSHQDGMSPRITGLQDVLFDSEEVNKWSRDIYELWTNNEQRLNSQTMETYAEAMIACGLNLKVDAQAARLLDWRYFFVDQEGVGHGACYVAARQAQRLMRGRMLDAAFARQ